MSILASGLGSEGPKFESPIGGACGITTMAHWFPLDPMGRMLLWSYPDRKTTSVVSPYLFFLLKKKKKRPICTIPYTIQYRDTNNIYWMIFEQRKLIL